MDAYKDKIGSGYFDLTKKVYGMFGMNEEEIKHTDYITKTFGVDKIEIGGVECVFVLLNTAWSCIDDWDNRNMLFGKFQLDAPSRTVSGKRSAISIRCGSFCIGTGNADSFGELSNSVSTALVCICISREFDTTFTILALPDREAPPGPTSAPNWPQIRRYIPEHRDKLPISAAKALC